MGIYKGITTEFNKDKTKKIMVRFQHQGRIFPPKNFTKIFGCKTQKSAYEKLAEVRQMLSKGLDPFSSSLNSLNEIFDEKVKTKTENKTWSESTISNYTYFYNSYMRKTIGMKKIEKIKYEDIKKILDSFEDKSYSNKKILLNILNPIIEEEIKKGNVFRNIIDLVELERPKGVKLQLNKRTNINFTEIVRRIYKSIPKYDGALEKSIEKHKMYLYFILMTSHRTNEIRSLKKEHFNLKEMKVIAPSDITKTDEDYHYPIPFEIIEYIKSFENDDDIVFDISTTTASRVFQRILRIAKIETIKDYTISVHDTRKLQISIMVNDLGIDSRLADYCLEHSIQGSIKHYLEFTYEDKVKAYKKYWNHIREVLEEEIEEHKKIVNKKSKNSNFEKLKELIEMYENNYITKEQFEFERDNLY